ncbi:uncharacterized protein TNCV_971831 [Trichonephila clavipes]|nr:uncharacterized protein TNCV_971831 [Trichonephila clavipes]
MVPHTIAPAVGAVCRCKAKEGLRHSPRGLHTRTRLSSLLSLNLDSSLKTTRFHSASVQFPRARHHSKRRLPWVDIKGSTRNGRHDPKCPSFRRRMGRLKTWANWALAQGLSRSQLSPNKITNSNNFNRQILFPGILRKIGNFGRYVNLLQDRRPRIGLVLSPYTIITHSVKGSSQSVQPVCTIGLLLCRGSGSQEILRRVWSHGRYRPPFDQNSEFDGGKILVYRDCGLSFREFGQRVGRNQETVMQICRH